ncbi:class V chitinase CHIT5 [Ricinus communis]|uniref:Chitinase, putative n=1 Tax=Ricinus communis TaxID=3988 RepID=B9RNX9_RICCO|nr:class V chitinase CHIT5 [Ricinus communis]EEF46897.1 chitinase, putative [Ricinus communis]|eukprot:XP_002515448.3 class V chitinase [Ricinus communis]
MANPKTVISPLIFLMLYTATFIRTADCDFFAQLIPISLAPSPYPIPRLDWSSPSPRPATPSYFPDPSSPSYPAIASPPAVPVSPSYPGTPFYPAEPTSPSKSMPEAPAANSPTYPVVSSPPAISVSPSYPVVPASPSEPSSEAPAANAPAISPTAPPPPPYPSQPPVGYDYQGIKAAYWPSFSGLDASAIDTTYFTHIYYAFLLLDPVTYKLDVTPFDQEKIPGFISTLRARNHPVTILLSIGGADINQTKYFSIMSSSRETREGFISSTIEVARNYGFDGLDLDWESPANDQEMLDLALLLSEWRNSLDLEATTTGQPRLLLSSAVYYSSRFTSYGEPRSYPVQAMNDFLDWINPMCYDYHGAWANFTGPNSALFDPYSNVSTSYGIGSWIESGVLPEKIVMGLPLYGRTWTLQNPNDHGIGARAISAGPGDGVLSYSQIMEFNSINKGAVHFDGATVSYYSTSGDSWIGYDDTISVDWKVRFARSRGLGGYFFWALGMDLDWTISRLASNSWDRK